MSGWEWTNGGGGEDHGHLTLNPDHPIGHPKHHITAVTFCSGLMFAATFEKLDKIPGEAQSFKNNKFIRYPKHIWVKQCSFLWIYLQQLGPFYRVFLSKFE